MYLLILSLVLCCVWIDYVIRTPPVISSQTMAIALVLLVVIPPRDIKHLSLVRLQKPKRKRKKANQATKG